ncbi:PAS domain S-box protein [Leptolyngbyaceae cyanobacterium CCMR0082]|uniref:Circadian input-output histidine kinase CikA n=1 Tax=Adonisia turfae CCMR0082 TaxID=2304604 RepID=A0A6M0S914_9CYAN|nr:PAS domain S-box protein [Adonisia turfae]NEZ64292.1 PAS domain S-box protein [Adonisia turfae CCMR0082]
MSDQALPSIPGYILTTKLYAGSGTVVYQAVRENHIVKPLAFVPWHHNYALIMADVGAISLRDYIQNHGHLSVGQVMAMALQLTDSLHPLNQHRILHKDINPANILIHPNTHQIWLTDYNCELERQVEERTRALQASEKRLRLAMRAANQGFYDLNLQTDEAIVSPDYALMLGYDPATFCETEANWQSRLHPDDRERVNQAYLTYKIGQTPQYRAEFRMQTRQGNWKWILTMGQFMEWDETGEPTRLLGTHTDISDRKFTEIQLAAQNALLAKIAQGQPLLDVLNALIYHIEHSLETVLCSVLLLDKENRLRHTTAPSLPTAYTQAIDGVLVGEGVGSCGTAAFRNQTVIVADIATDPLWSAYRDLALTHGLKASWSSPIQARGGQVLGTLAMYYKQVRSPQTHELKMITQMAHIAGIAIERHQADAQLRQSEATLLKAQQVAHVGNWEFDIASQTITWSPEMFRIYGLEPTASAPSYPDYLHMLPAEACLQLQSYVERALAEGTPYTIEYSRTRSDGSLSHHEYRAEVEQDEQGQAIRLLGTVLDITDLKQAELALQNLVTGTAATIGQDFFPALVHHISVALDVPIALITQFVDQELQSLAFIVDGEPQPNFAYDLPETPCRDLVVNYSYHCPSGVSEHFPNNPMREKAVESYLGVALRDRQGQVLGSLCIFDRQHLRDPKRAKQILEVFSGRVSAELERQRAENALQNLIEGTAALTGPDFFPALVQHIATALNASHAFVTEIVEGNQLRYLAAWGDGQHLPNEIVEVEGTTCGFTLRAGVYHCEREVIACFPQNPRLVSMAVESYMGVALQNRQGQALGTLCIFSRQSIVNPEHSQEILRVFADRAAAELERLRAQTALEQLNQKLEQRVERRTQELARSEQDLRTIFNNVYDGIMIHDLGGTVLDVNDRYVEMLGATREQILAASIADFMAPEAPIEQILEITQQVAKGKDLRVKWKARRLDNDTTFDVDVSLKKLMLGNRPVIIACARDISDRQRAESALHLSEARAHAAFEQAAVGIAESSLTDGKITRTNNYFCQMTGYTAQELESLTSADLTYFEDLNDSQQQIKQLFTGAIDSFTLEKRYIRKDGSYFWATTAVTLIQNPAEDSPRCLAVIQDISDRKAAETQLQRTNAELVRATRLKDEFLANMSHELRTPLNAILGLSEALQEKAFGPLTKQQLKYLKTIEHSGTHLLNLINDILDVAKIEAGQLELELSVTNIESLCESSLALVKQQALKKRISLTTTIPPNSPTLAIDARRILQSLVNLLNNAIKFTPEGGCVALAVRYHHQDDPSKPSHLQKPSEVMQASHAWSWESGPLTARHYLKLSVADTGIGIAQKHITKLFKPFSQIDSTLNRKYTGTGLGLVLVKQMAELHGGTVSLTSEVGVGSCFSINLPYESVAPLIEPGQSPHQISPLSLPVSGQQDNSPLILLAEDNQDTISLMVSYLETIGYRLMVANNGLDALELAHTHHPDLILMDIQMPDLDGLKSIQRIRHQDSTLKSVPIIVLTALVMAGDQERCLAAGANEYLGKPVKLKQLALTIQKLLVQ